MRTKILSRSVNDLVTVVEAKEHSRIEGIFDDSLIQSYLFACFDIAEKQTNRALFPSEAVAYFPEYQEKTYLPLGNVSSITSVVAKDPMGDDQTLAITDYSMNSVDESVTILDLFKKYTDFRITYSCGYSEGGVPDAIKQGILLCFGTLYNVREDVSYGVQGYEVPVTSKRLFNLYKIPASR